MPVNLVVLFCKGPQQERGSRSAFVRAVFCLFMSFVLTAEAYGSELDGYWQHPDDPVWIEVNVAKGTGVAMRNDASARTIVFRLAFIRAFRAVQSGSSEPSSIWRSLVYYERGRDNMKFRDNGRVGLRWERKEMRTMPPHKSADVTRLLECERIHAVAVSGTLGFDYQQRG